MKKLLVVLVLIVMGLAYFAYRVSQGRAPAASEDAYTYESLQYGTIRDTVNAGGKIVPTDTLIISSDVPGRVLEITRDVNQEVLAGELLIRLDERQAQEKLKEAEAACDQARAAVRAAEKGVEQAKGMLDVAQKKLDKARHLLKADQFKPVDVAPAEAEFEAGKAGVAAAEERVGMAKGALKQAEAKRDEAKLGVELTRIYVPQTIKASKPGVGELGPRRAEGQPKQYTVLDRKVVLNQIVGPTLTTPLFVLAGDLKEMQVLVQIAEADIGRVTKGQEAEFTVRAYEDLHFPAKVGDSRQMPTSEHGVVFYQVVLDVQNQWDKAAGTWRLLPGMTASVDIIRRTHKDVWKVPSTAVDFQLDEAYQSREARAKIDSWYQTHNHDEWKPLWVIHEHKPYPMFVRIGGKNAQGDPGIQDAQSYEALEWDPELQATLNPKDPATYPRVIVGAPPAKGSGLFNLPNIKF